MIMKFKNAICRFILAGLVIAALGSEPVLAIPLVSVEPTSQNLIVGDTASVSIVASDVTDLYAYQFDLTLDPTVLTAVGLTEGTLLAAGGATAFVPGTVDNSAGLISFTVNTLTGPVAGVDGSGSLALVQFFALANGVSPIILSNVVLLNSSLAEIQANTAGGEITVQGSPTPIPEPSSFWLIAVGTLSIGMYGWSHARHARNTLAGSCRNT